MNRVYVLLDYESDVYGVYSSEKSAWEAAEYQLKLEGIDPDTMEDHLEDWRVLSEVVED